MRLTRLLALMVVVSAAFAQPDPDTLWTRTFGGWEDECAYAVQQTSDGSYIIAGETETGGDMYFVKLDSMGNHLWTRTYGGDDHDLAYDTKETTDNGYIIAGYTNSMGAGQKDFFIVKTDVDGERLWARTNGEADNDEAHFIQQTSDGGYIIVGCMDCWGIGSDYYLVKADSVGNQQWARTYGGSYTEIGEEVVQTIDGGYLIAGNTWSFGAGLWDIYLVKTDSAGYVEWSRTYGGSNHDWTMAVQQTSDGGYIMAVITMSFGHGLRDAALWKLDSMGDTVWTCTFGGTNEDRIWSVHQMPDGSYISAGSTWSFGMTQLDFYLAKVSAEGDTLWTRRYGGEYDDYAYSVDLTSDGGYVLAGYTESFGAGEKDFYVVKTGPDLNSGAGMTSADLLPISCCLHTPYPNPFNAATVIEFEMLVTGAVQVGVYNVLGRKVATLVDGQVGAGVHQMVWDAGKVPSGVYFCRMDARGFNQVVKLVLLK